MAINVGYSIGFGYPAEPYTNYHWFSSLYVIIGASFVAVALGFFADKIGEDHDNWFINMVQQEKYEAAFAAGKSWKSKFKHTFIQHAPAIRAVGLWLAWIGIMIFYSMVNVGWSFTEAQYFAISTCSTGGHWSIPNDSPDWMFGVTGFFALLGVPIMGVAMATVARGLVSHGDMEATKELIREEVTAEELEMLHKFGLEDGDGQIDRSEFIILCMVRTGTDPNLVKYISERFTELDEDGGGTLTVEEITKGKFTMVDGKIQQSFYHKKAAPECAPALKKETTKTTTTVQKTTDFKGKTTLSKAATNETQFEFVDESGRDDQSDLYSEYNV